MTTRLEQAQERLLTEQPPTTEVDPEVGPEVAAVIAYWNGLAEEKWMAQAALNAPSQRWNGPRGRWLTVYHVQQAYGGPEEGGWWYNVGERLEHVDVRGRDLHDAVMELVAKYDHMNDSRGLYSVISTGVIRIEGATRYIGPKYTPETRPYYC